MRIRHILKDHNEIVDHIAKLADHNLNSLQRFKEPLDSALTLLHEDLDALSLYAI